MNTEHSVPGPIDRTSARKLREACEALTETMSAGKWHLQGRRRIGMERYMTEEVGFGLNDEGSNTPPTELLTRAAFTAYKEKRLHPAGFSYDETLYDIRMTIGQSITHEEMPENILDELFSEDGDEENDDDDEGFETESILDEITRDDLGDILIMREEELIYRVNGRGKISGFDINHTYSFDDEVVYEMPYSTEEGGPTSIPLYRAEDGTVIDRRPMIVTVLTPRLIKEEVSNIDTSLQEFLSENALRRSLDLRRESSAFHRRRALGVVSLIGSGMAIRRFRP